MKVTVNVECTPEEARSFLGLPNVEPVNDMMVEAVSERMKSQLDLVDPNQFVAQWMSLGGRVTDVFWNAMTHAAETAQTAQSPTRKGAKPKS